MVSRAVGTSRHAGDKLSLTSAYGGDELSLTSAYGGGEVPPTIEPSTASRCTSDRRTSYWYIGDGTCAPTIAAPWRWATETVGGGGYNGYTGRWSPLGLDAIRQASANTTSIGREIDRPSGACDRPAASRAEASHITQVYLGVSAVSRSKQGSVNYGLGPRLRGDSDCAQMANNADYSRKGRPGTTVSVVYHRGPYVNGEAVAGPNSHTTGRRGAELKVWLQCG
jgi:hypothetical protein